HLDEAEVEQVVPDQVSIRASLGADNQRPEQPPDQTAAALIMPAHVSSLFSGTRTNWTAPHCGHVHSYAPAGNEIMFGGLCSRLMQRRFLPHASTTGSNFLNGTS